MSEQLCGSRLAHMNCQFAGDWDEGTMTLRCAAPSAQIHNDCEYNDIGGVHHRRWQSALGGTEQTRRKNVDDDTR